MTFDIRTCSLGVLAALACASLAATAQTLPPPQNVANLSASASVEVQRDWLSVVLSTTREGSDAAVVQGQLKQALDAALAEARKVAKAGQVEVQTGGFSLSPRYAPKGGGITGWQGGTELVVEGRDSATIAQLSGRVTTMSISRVSHSLSREARQKVEGEVAAMAIDRFRARADAVSKQFGFTGYTVREVTVNSDGGGEVPMPRMRVQTATLMADGAPLPVEAGKATVTANVSGSVQMK
ncbi:MAG: SIMPL domain-containing protein [Leptothrix sp. (in: Bacteria)]|nr:SIMPL domain-containing protein [Leptothrix sp. (in: b-proteobacteria)]